MATRKATRKKKATRPRPFEQAEPRQYPVYYINNAEVRRTNWDIELRLSRLLEAGADRVTFEPIASVYMSVEHARRLVTVLSGQLTMEPPPAVVGDEGLPEKTRIDG